jgi:ribulose-bisphosphate carboxylase large chain
MNDVRATYFFRPRKGIGPEEAARAISIEGTTGKVTGSFTNKRLTDFEGHSEDMEPSGRGYKVSIHFPSKIFEPGNIAQYLSIVTGKVFGLQELDAVRLLDLRLPDELVPFHGPKFGISGIRRLVGTIDRPHIGTIIKPNIGLNPKEAASVAYEAAIGGSDLVMDDGLLTDQKFCTIHDRVPEVMARLDEARSETGQKTLYAVNITSMPDAVMERATKAIDLGAEMVMVNIVAAGYGVLRILSGEPGLRVPIHVYCTLHPGLGPHNEQGVALLPMARLVRMLGGDQFHIGSMSGRKNRGRGEEVQHRDALLTPEFGHRRSFPVVSGGIHPGNVAEEIAGLGNDIVIIAGRGVHEHPDGTRAGISALRQGVDACMAGIPVTSYAMEHYDLERALKFFGNK